ncbi:MAG: diadenylate cyclase CdaA [Endomicrobiaceae bacterium]|nr:diadenylate cyclase CdaA [Endomicrobiaceae bacterium]
MDIFSQIWSQYIINALDILIVSYIFYRILLIIKGTKATQIIFGLVILLCVTILAKDVVHLRTLSWLLEKFWVTAVIILAVVFQGEIRYGLAKLGSKLSYYNHATPVQTSFLEEIIEAAIEMSKSRTGALIVLEKEMGLKNYTDTGINIDARISQELILSIFQTKSPIHDGAIIIHEERLHSAGCVLPISTEIEVKHLGTRHRAGIGLSSITDAVVLIVSEETGKISIAVDGEIEIIQQSDLLKTISKYYLKKD